MNFEPYFAIVSIILLVEVVIIIFLWRKLTGFALYITIVSILAKGQYIWVGLPFFAWQAAAAIGLLYNQNSIRRIETKALGLRYLLYSRRAFLTLIILQFAIAIPIWGSLYLTPRIGNAPNIELSRAFTQLAYISLLAGIFLFGILLGKRLGIDYLLRATLNVATFIAYVSIVQVATFYSLGINLFPIIRADGSLESAYVADLIFRASSFAGEPKHLGISSAIGFSAWLVMRLSKVELGRFWIHKPSVLLASIALSLSGTGFILLVAALLTALTLSLRRMHPSVLVIFVIISGASWIAFTVANENFVETMIQQFGKTSFEIQDLSVFSALVENPVLLPFGAGLGNIHLYAVNHLPSDFPLFRDHGYKANSGFFYILGDGGIIALFLLIASTVFLAMALRPLRTSSSDNVRKLATASTLFAFVSLMMFLLRYTEIHFFFLGFLIASASVLYRERTGMVKLAESVSSAQ